MDFKLQQLKHLGPRGTEQPALASSLCNTYPWSGLWVKDQTIPLHCQGQSWQHSVMSFPHPHFFSHPIMGNETKNPQEVKGVTLFHNRYDQIMKNFICWCTQKMKPFLLLGNSAFSTLGKNDELCGTAQGSPSSERKQRSLYLVQNQTKVSNKALQKMRR